MNDHKALKMRRFLAKLSSRKHTITNLIVERTLKIDNMSDRNPICCKQSLHFINVNNITRSTSFPINQEHYTST